MVSGKAVGLGVVAIALFVVGFPIWAGIFFGMYYPLKDRDWKDSVCIVTDVEHYQTGYTTTHLYVQYKLAVQTKERVVPGYACESSENHSAISSNSEDNAYPYEYAKCDSHIERGVCRPGQLFLPRWICNGYKGIPQYVVGDAVECKYYVNGDLDAESFSYPRKGEDFVEVLFKDEVYFPTDDYNALWVIPFGLMSILPCVLVCIFVCPEVLGWCRYDERQKYYDFWERFVCCKRSAKPRRLRRYGDFLEKVEPKPILVWLFSVKKHPTVFKFKANLVHEIADYLA